MNRLLLQNDVQSFINQNLTTDFKKISFAKNPFANISYAEILNQIYNKVKAKTKLPSFFECIDIIYPSKISLEQSSSEITAKYKAGLVVGETLVDLTGGFGVDDFYFSKKIKKVTHCEMNSDLHQIAKHNFKQLKTVGIECFGGDSHVFLEKSTNAFSWIYVDPSRRNDAKGKVFMLKDCLPNVVDSLDFYFTKSQNILIKTSPILDISAGLLELNFVSQIHIVAVNNEVKELLWILIKDFIGHTIIKAINILENNVQNFEFILKESNQIANTCLPQKYLFEPNAAIMKSGGFDEITSQFEVEKLHQHSHLYTSDSLVDFPGRIFEIENCFEYNKQNMKSFLENKKANITTRNFPETVENIRKKWKINDGGNLYCFFTTDGNNNKIVLLCSKLK